MALSNQRVIDVKTLRYKQLFSHFGIAMFFNKIKLSTTFFVFYFLEVNC